MIAHLRTTMFNIVFYGGSVLYVLLAPLVALLGEGPLRRWVLSWTRWHRFCAAVFTGIRTQVEGQVPQTPMLVVAKHQAFFETFEMVCLLDAPVIVLKQELRSIPLWGWTAERYGMIVVDRDGSAKALRAMVKKAEAAIAEGRSVVIFPEGTRVPPGATPPLKPGFVGLYRALKRPLVSVAIDSGHFWPKRGAKRPGAITFRFHPPVEPGLSREAIEARVHAEINALETGAA